ncbi:hypothetical protein T07_12654 [Trichinella nelsoni]|uniref:Uncharacterized protein n=1 Tax=Trichinella nelsoni TaxID=6336 RepID=A0A0V0RCU2_9BILA|nr:hypothetical protein T07_12654 [Trichinella nelsoni]
MCLGFNSFGQPPRPIYMKIVRMFFFFGVENEQKITVNGGSLGSYVDEKRGETRKFM